MARQQKGNMLQTAIKYGVAVPAVLLLGNTAAKLLAASGFSLDAAVPSVWLSYAIQGLVAVLLVEHTVKFTESLGEAVSAKLFRDRSAA